MVTREELFAAIKLLRDNCMSFKGCLGCPLKSYCHDKFLDPCAHPPCIWPDPEEGESDA